jgi:hypothetical protein
MIHIYDLLYKLYGVMIDGAVGAGRACVFFFALQGHDIFYAEVVEFYQGVFGLLSGEAVTEEVGDGFYAVFIFNDGAEAEGAGASAFDSAAKGAVRLLLPHDFGGMAGDVDIPRAMGK